MPEASVNHPRCCVCPAETTPTKRYSVVVIQDEQFIVCPTHDAQWNDAVRMLFNGWLTLHDKPMHVFRETRLLK